MSKDKYISPISIDLGAKNTGVYSAHYRAGSPLDDIEKKGKVYQLEKDAYTLLMVNRTATRHQKRGYDRRRMVKRLFKLIWEKHFGLPWDNDVQQTISFLLNRRGFSFLAEEYDAEVLSRFPEEVYELLPEKLKKIEPNENGEYDLHSALTDWIQEDAAEETVREKFDAINREPKRIGQRLVYIGRTKKLREYCNQLLEKDDKIQEKQGAKIKLSKLSGWILEKWRQEGVQGLPDTSDKNIVDHLNEWRQDKEITRKILGSLPDYSKEERELKDSYWYFPKNFKRESADFGRPDDGEKKQLAWVRTHLHHLAFALHKALDELQSGGRHRSKYFKEIKDVFKEIESKLQTDKTEGLHGYLKHFYKKLDTGEYKGLDVKALINLVGHLSNLELKPLRKYFNDKKHKNGDYWDEVRLTEKIENWILREWRINPQKDKLKAGGADYDYGELKKLWNNRIGTIIDFWMATDPNWTVPPYQDNNNRRPPKCQSLILNVGYLDCKYPAWQSWLRELTQHASSYLENYKYELENLKSGKGNPYFSNESTGSLRKTSGRRSLKQLDARVLQFILDRVKASDPLNLNEIYSHAKKYRQLQSTLEERNKAREQLDKAVKDSELPETEELKTPRNYENKAIFAEGTFLHLVCRYYKIRQKARDGRVFIHPEYRYVKERGYENTGRFDDKLHLLTYCNHKPRQKRYQLLNDLAGVLRVSSDKLKSLVQDSPEDTIDEKKIVDWLGGIAGLKGNCTTASKEQKDRRGRLKMDIQSVFGLISHRTKEQDKSYSNKEIKNILKSSKVVEPYELYSFCNKAKKLCLTITKNLYDIQRQQQWEENLKKNPASAIYLLAQVNNLVFKERSGNASTCAVCSVDNAQRMQMVATKKGATAKAQRLPAIPTRLIDGAVMRMARIVGNAIAKDKWPKIEAELKKGNEVCVPIITESNRFEFEPDLKTLKGKPLGDKDKKYRETDLAVDKDQRIKEASQGICPYTGDDLSGGDKDHIIPRSSKWGTLNDEANLIWASDEGNKKIKKDNEFSLRHLSKAYRKKQFGNLDEREITDWVVEQIGDGNTDEFKFGQYRSFINLRPDEQKAFRHALFMIGHPLREKVINAIDNRTRTLVNGTQRYFAEVLANNLYKEAKRIGREGQLFFDFFGVEAQSNPRGDGIKDLRCAYEKTNDEIFVEYAKKKEEKQKIYSHLIDAQLAFVMAADAHRNDGSLGLVIDDAINMWPFNKNTGEVLDNIFDSIKVKPEKMKQCHLARRKPDENFSSHRAFTRDTFYADRYLPVLLQKSENGSIIIRVGFDLQNSVVMRTDTKAKSRELLTNLVELLPFCKETQQLVGRKYDDLNDLFTTMERVEYFARQLKKQSYCYLTVNRLKLHEYWAKSCNTKNGKPFNDKAFAYKTLRYTTEKITIEKPEDLNKTLENDKKKDGKKKNERKFFTWEIQGQSVTLPVKRQWESCLEAWRKSEANGESFEKFLRSHFSSSAKHSHQKARKVFSLPVLTSQGKFMLRRESWQGNNTFQIVNDSDSRSPDNKPNIPVRLEDGSMGIKLAKWARSENIVKFPSKEKYQDGETISPTDWYALDRDRNSFPDGIDQIWYRIGRFYGSKCCGKTCQKR